MTTQNTNASHVEKKREILVFISLVLVVAPLLVTGIVASVGLTLWLTQLVLGPTAG